MNKQWITLSLAFVLGWMLGDFFVERHLAYKKDWFFTCEQSHSLSECLKKWELNDLYGQ